MSPHEANPSLELSLVQLCDRVVTLFLAANCMLAARIALLAAGRSTALSSKPGNNYNPTGPRVQIESQKVCETSLTEPFLPLGD